MTTDLAGTVDLSGRLAHEVHRRCVLWRVRIYIIVRAVFMNRERQIALVALIRGQASHAIIYLIVGVRAHETLQNLRIAA